MEYVNPTSIAGMAQQPGMQGSMLPGTGAGPLDAYLNNEAKKQAYDFLDMAKAKEAQNYVKGQWELQTAHDQYGLDKQAKELGNQERQQKLQQGEQTMKLDAEKLKQIKQSGVINKLAFVGSIHEPLSQAQSPMEAAAIIKQAQARYAQMFPDDPQGAADLDWDGNPATLPQLAEHFRTAGHIAREADAQHIRAEGLQKQGEGAKQKLQDHQLSVQERMNDADNATRLEVARIGAAAKKATEGGGNAWSSFKDELGRTFWRAQAKPDKERSAEEKAAMILGPQILAGGFASTELKSNPEVIRKGAEAKSGGEFRGLINEIRPPKQAPVGSSPKETDEDRARLGNLREKALERDMRKGHNFDPNKLKKGDSFIDQDGNLILVE